jgi:hypothetical protein
LTRRVLILLAAVAVTLVGVAATAQMPPAQAHDHRIPKTVLKKGARELQEGLKVIDSNWSHPTTGNECVDINSVYVYRFPEQDRVAAGSKLRVRLLKSQKPDSFTVTAYPRLNSEGIPRGEARQLNTSLRGVVQDGQTVAWDAIFFVNGSDRHYYLITEGHWHDRQGCGGDQWAHWSFHVRT